MEFSSQFYTAPSLKSRPKLGRTTVSSSIFRGVSSTASKVSAIKVPKGMQISPRASYVDPKYLKKESTPLEKTLIETNNILLEIQKQLSADYAYRISREEQEAKKIRLASDKKKREKAESGVESVKKIGDVIGKQVDKITSPIKNVFDRILQFFGALITGFAINQGLKWLSTPGNPEKITQFFDFLAKHKNTILMIIGGALIYKVVSKIVRIYRALRAVGRFLSGFRRRGGGASSGDNFLDEGSKRRGGLFRNAAGGRRGISVEMERVTRTKPGSGGLLHEGVDIAKRTKTPVGRALQRVDVAGAQLGRNMLKAIGMGPGAKGIMGFLRPVFKRIPIFGALIDFAVSLALGEPIGRAAAKAVGAGLGGALGTFLGPVGTVLGGILGDFVGGSLYDAIVGPGKDASQEKPEIEMNSGGTIPGPNVNKDIVPLLGTPGEKVVPVDPSRKFGPFIDDMIYNGGELYLKMISSLKRQEENNLIFASTNKKFEEVLKDYDDFVKKIKLKETDPELFKKIYGIGGGESRSTSQPMTRLSVGNLMNASEKSGQPMDFVGEINVNLRQPRIVAKSLTQPSPSSPITILPPIPMGGSKNPVLSGTSKSPPSGGNSIPFIDPEDFNYYVSYTMQELGIYGD